MAMKTAGKSRMRRRGSAWLAALLTLALLLALNFGLEKLDDAAYLRLDLSPDSVASLSERTLAELAALDTEATFTAARRTGAQTELGAMLDELLEKYAAESPLVRVRVLDPDLRPYEFTALNESGAVIADDTVFVTLNGRTMRVNADQFLYARTLDGETYRLFCGDARFAGILAALRSGETRRAVFLTGHGETEASACQTAALSLSAAGLEVCSLPIAQADLTSNDMALLLAPQVDLTISEAKTLATFVDGGGALLLACDASADFARLKNFATLLDLYGLGYESGTVVESVGESERYIDTPDTLCPIATDASICETLDQRLIFPNACAIAAPSFRAEVTTEALLTTSATAYRKLAGGDLYTFEPGDASGRQTLALSATASGRIVLLSSVRALLDDGQVSGANLLDASDNLDFFTACAGWLTGGDAIEGSTDLKVLPNNAIVFDDESQRETLTVWSVAALPTLVALVGVAVLLVRRRRAC